MKYTVASSVGCTVGPGQRMRLTAAQIATRSHALTVTNADVGEIVANGPLFFKRGEVFELPLKWKELDSYYRSVLETEDGEAPPAEKKPTPVGKVVGRSVVPKPAAKSKAALEAAAAAKLKAATDAVDAAKAKLATAADDAKPAAQAELETAEAAVAALKA